MYLLDFNNFNNFNDFGSGSSNKRDKLEIGDSGKSRGEERSDARQDTVYGNRFRRGRNRGGRNTGGIGRGFKVIANILFWLFLVLVLYLLNLNYGWVDLDFNKKMTQEEGYATLINSTKEVHRDAGINSGVVEEMDEVYETNNIFDGSTSLQLQDSVYLVYPYTLTESDELFNLFIESYGEDVPVYPVGIENIREDIGYNYLEYYDENRFSEPHFIMYSHVTGEENEPIGIYFEEDLGNVVSDFNEALSNNKNKDEWR